MQTSHAMKMAEFSVTPVHGRDGETGVEVTRYEYASGDAQVFYYHSEALTPDGRYLPHWSNITGSWQIHVLDRQSDVSVLVSQSPVCVHDAPAHDTRRHRVYRVEGARLWWTDYLTGESAWVFEIPPGFATSHVTLNSDYLVLCAHEDTPVGSVPSPQGPRPLPRNACAFPRSQIAGVHLDTGAVEVVWGDLAFLTHAIMSRVNNDYVVFADQSAHHLQMELFSVVRPLINDKKPRRIFHAASGGMNYVGHAFLTGDGFVACQMREFLGVDELNRYTDKCSYHAIARWDGSGYRRARFPGREKPMHSHGQLADGLWVADGWTRPDGRLDMDWISVVRNRWTCMDMEIWPLVRISHHHRRPFHVHPWISPDEREVVFSAHHEGRNHLFVAEVPAAYRSEKWPPLPQHMAPGLASSSRDDRGAARGPSPALGPEA